MLTDREVRGFSSLLERLYACEDLDQFPRVVLDEVPKLVGSDHTTFNYLAPAIPKTTVIVSHDVGQHQIREERFARLLADQPVIRHFFETGDPSAHKLSDFQTVREYHRTAIYRHLYHDLSYEDQMAIWLFPPGAEMVALALSRDRRSFTERDRDVLNLLRPHLAQAYRRAEHVTRLRRLLERNDRKTDRITASTILLDAQCRPIRYPDEAQRWMQDFFPGIRRDSRRLPAPVEAWITRELTSDKPLDHFLPRARGILRRRSVDARLFLRILPQQNGVGYVLMMERHSSSDPTGALLAAGLSRREVEVLLQLERGKTNDEIAVALGVSSFTVRTHLEHIFDKLSVHTRTAAVTRMRELLAR